MASLTAIELGANTCVLVRAAGRGPTVSVSEVETLDPTAFPGGDAFVAALKQSRKAHRFPRRARVVLWGLPEGAAPRDPAVEPLLGPLKQAGFRVERVVSPCNALAALARLRQPRGDAAVAWLAVNRSGVAIVAVKPGELLHAHSFQWDSSIGATGSQARLLQRYTLVAHLAPEVRRAIEDARAKGARVDAVVTCGNLPDLRSLTMPLIEELDIEVETLDTLDGIEMKPALRDSLAEVAPAVRLAVAGAIARPARERILNFSRMSAGRIVRAAALVVAVAGVGWLWWSRKMETPASHVPAPAVTKPSPVGTKHTPPRATTPPPVVAKQTPPAATPPPPAVAKQPPPAVTKPAAVVTRQTPPPARKPAPAVTKPAPAVAKPAPATTRAAAPSPTPTHAAAAPVLTPPARLPDTRQPATPAGRRPAQNPPAHSVLASPPGRADNPGAARTPVVRPVPENDAPLLTDPLPRVSTILVSAERRFAMVDGGRIVHVGDTVGQRVVAGIEPRALVLREPSGVQIRVGLGGRLLSVERRSR